MRPEDRVRLSHMIDACEAILRFTRGRTLQEFKQDQQFEFAVAHALQIVLEAGSRLSPEAKDGLPEIAWAQMGGMRNRLVHAYFDTDQDVLWRTATIAIPDLLGTLRAHDKDS